MVDTSGLDALIAKHGKSKPEELPPVVVTPDDEKPNKIDTSGLDALIAKHSKKEPAKSEQKADDHGLSERLKRSTVEKALTPVIDYSKHYGEMRDESAALAGRGASEFADAWSKAEPGSMKGLADAALGAGKVALGGIGYVASPLSALYRAVLGQPVEDVTGIPREYTEFAAQLATPGIGFPRAPGAVPPAEIPRVPPGFRTGPEPPPPPPSVAESAGRLNEQFGTNVPRAVASDSRTAQVSGQGVSKMPVVGNQVAQAVEDVAPQLGRARSAVAEEYGTGTAPNAASRIERELTTGAEAETQAATAAAAERDRAALAEWQRANAERDARIVEQEARSGQAAQRAVGPDAEPLDMGDVVINRVRQNEQAAQTRKNQLYDDAASREGTVYNEAIAGANRHVNESIAGEVTIRPRLTPAAAEMQRSMRQFSNRAQATIEDATGRAQVQGGPVERTGLNLQAIEAQRKELGRMANGATTDEDARAARRIMEAFDDWQETVMRPGRNFDGDADALTAYREARAANRDWRERFGYNGRDDADKLINKVVRGVDDQHTGPVGVSDALTARNDKSGPLFAKVMEATGNDAEVHQAIRSGTWNKLSRDPEGVTPRSAERVSSDIYQHLHGRGRDVAERVFSDEQRALMRAHADSVREADRARRASPQIAKASEPVPTKVEPGPMQRLADDVIGGGKSDEALYRSIEGLAKAKGSANVKQLAEIMRRVPQQMKGDFVHSFINRLGVSQKTQEFSPAIFAKEWESITPQAKAVLFGNAGPHLQALNDIAAVSRRLEQVQSKFGNPSGTGSVLNFSHGLTALVGSVVSGHPMVALSTVAGAIPPFMLSRYLASPVGASSIAKFSRATERLNQTPNLQNAAAAKLALRNVVNTAKSISPPEQR
jgi:hypothetical protein